MFQNLLKWSFRVLVGEVEKEFHLHLDHDAPLDAVEQVGMQILKHCGNVRDQIKAQEELAKLEKEKADEGKEPEKAEEEVAKPSDE